MNSQLQIQFCWNTNHPISGEQGLEILPTSLIDDDGAEGFFVNEVVHA